MAEYIERNELINYLSGCIVCLTLDTEDCKNVMLHAISKFPKSDVAHSKWEICSDGYYLYCNNCRYEPPRQVGMTKYCPNCGARMDGDTP